MSTPTETAAVEQRLRALRDERDQLAAAEDADPVRAAEDLDAWHHRDSTRRRRRLEIERETRDLEEWGDLVDHHGTELRAYLNVARAAAQRHARLIDHRVFGVEPGTGTVSEGRRDLEQWWMALSTFARALDHRDENVRRVLAREVDSWVKLRQAWLTAVAIDSGRGRVPSPEVGIGGELPDWLRIGATRTDKADR